MSRPHRCLPRLRNEETGRKVIKKKVSDRRRCKKTSTHTKVSRELSKMKSGHSAVFPGQLLSLGSSWGQGGGQLCSDPPPHGLAPNFSFTKRSGVTRPETSSDCPKHITSSVTMSRIGPFANRRLVLGLRFSWKGSRPTKLSSVFFDFFSLFFSSQLALLNLFCVVLTLLSLCGVVKTVNR